MQTPKLMTTLALLNKILQTVPWITMVNVFWSIQELYWQLGLWNELFLVLFSLGLRSYWEWEWSKDFFRFEIFHLGIFWQQKLAFLGGALILSRNFFQNSLKISAWPCMYNGHVVLPDKVQPNLFCSCEIFSAL